MSDPEANGPVDAEGAGDHGAGEVPSLDLDAVAADLDDVATALERLEDGSYGTCEACGAALPDEVLVERPAARRCAEHAT